MNKERETKGGTMSEQSKIHIVLRKKNKYGVEIYIMYKEKDDIWLPLYMVKKSLTKHNIDYLKQTGRFTFELQREEI